RIFAVAAVAALATALLFGTAPAIQAARVPAGRALASSPWRGGSRFAAGDPLVIAQLALSTVLVVASGLFVHSFVRLAYRDLGFDRDRVGIAVVDLRHSASGTDARLAFFDALREAAASAPGVEAAAVSMATPIGPSGIRMMSNLEIPRTAGAAPTTTQVLLTPVSPRWFRVYGTRLLEGRDFDRSDVAGGPAVAIVNQAFAQKYFKGADPIGHTIVETAKDSRRTSLTIIGIVEDAAFTSVRAALDPVLYKPLAQVLAANPILAQLPNISVSLRTAQGAPLQSVDAAVAAAIARIDPEGSLMFQQLDAQLNAFYIRERLLAMIAGFFGVLGLVLAAVGLYGVMSYGVNRRRREIGIRMALGADTRTVRRMVLGRLVALSGAGIAAGAVVSFWLARTIASLLYGVRAHDGLAFAAGLIMLAATACVAAWAPIRGAARLDPAVVLRES
ncbi:MAG TPA: ABC transporter permease, partial [Vicinamibacterales bacterium]